MKKIYGIRVILIALIVLWMSIIFGFSSETGNQSQSLSDGITVKVVKIFEPEYEKLSKTGQEKVFNQFSFLVRKAGHFGEYGILGVLITMLALTFESYRKLKFRYKIILVSVAFIYACTDELHQGFVDGRSPKMLDVCIDTCGALAGTVIFLGIFNICNLLGGRNETVGTIH